LPIVRLPEGVVARIAAGEVVERPASVVKELIENALDAGARQVRAEARGGGVPFLCVGDDGCGIPPDEVPLAFSRHATSKIRAAEDLWRVRTLGFRGEALASVAAAAQVQLVTRPADCQAATCARAEHGVVVDIGPCAGAVGTTVTVRNLFSALPARLRFLKSPGAENAAIGQAVTSYALAYPEVRFTLEIDGRLVLRTTGSGDPATAALEVYGLEVSGSLLPIRAAPLAQAAPGAEGMVSAPDIHRGNRGGLLFFVNRRWIHSRALGFAVEEAYRGLLMVGRHPLGFLAVALPPEDIDVNVHPTKAEVKFRREREVAGMLHDAVKSALLARAPVPAVAMAGGSAGWRPALEPEALAPEIQSALPPAPPVDLATDGARRAFPRLRAVGQLGSTYIVAEGGDGMYLIDQHAAHERVLFDRLSAAIDAGAVEVQGLLEPVEIELGPEQAAGLDDLLGDLERLGVGAEPFGPRALLVRRVPAVLSGAALGTSLRALLEDRGHTDWRRRALTTLACHGSVRAGQILAPDEMRALIDQLQATPSPRTCPHGRPTMLHLSVAQLERQFGRR
jgi:DNA mismatch repair protein MutL